MPDLGATGLYFRTVTRAGSATPPAGAQPLPDYRIGHAPPTTVVRGTPRLLIGLNVGGKYSYSTAPAGAPDPMKGYMKLGVFPGGRYTHTVPPPSTSTVFTLGFAFSLAPRNFFYEWTPTPIIVYGPDPNLPPPPPDLTPPDPADVPPPPDTPPDITVDAPGTKIAISFTPNAQDDPDWTTIGG